MAEDAALVSALEAQMAGTKDEIAELTARVKVLEEAAPQQPDEPAGLPPVVMLLTLDSHGDEQLQTDIDAFYAAARALEARSKAAAEPAPASIEGKPQTMWP